MRGQAGTRNATFLALRPHSAEKLAGLKLPAKQARIIETLASAKQPIPPARLAELAGSTQANGFLGAYLKFCGFDGIIFQGQADHLVYVVIRDGKAEIRDARHLAGTRTDRMEDLIREELGAGKKEVTGANVLVAIFGEKDSHAVYFLHRQDITRFDVVNFLSHGVSKVAGEGAAGLPGRCLGGGGSGQRVGPHRR